MIPELKLKLFRNVLPKFLFCLMNQVGAFGNDSSVALTRVLLLRGHVMVRDGDCSSHVYFSSSEQTNVNAALTRVIGNHCDPSTGDHAMSVDRRLCCSLIIRANFISTAVIYIGAHLRSLSLV